MRCPKCEDAQLEAITVDDVEVDRCTRGCEGIWFDRAELGELLDSQEGSLTPLMGGDSDPERDTAPGACPRDKAPLLRVISARNHRVVLDCCPMCKGIWLDGGEFRRIKTAQPGIRLGQLV